MHVGGELSNSTVVGAELSQGTHREASGWLHCLVK